MKRLLKPLSLGTVIAAAFASGFWLATVRSVRADSHTRVFELRTYIAQPGKLDALNARFRNHTTRLFEKHGMENIGYWVPKSGPAAENTLIYIVAHKNEEAAKKSWAGFRNDPDWKKAQQASEANGKLVEKVESVYMTPTDYSKMK